MSGSTFPTLLELSFPLSSGFLQALGGQAATQQPCLPACSTNSSALLSPKMSWGCAKPWLYCAHPLSSWGKDRCLLVVCLLLLHLQPDVWSFRNKTCCWRWRERGSQAGVQCSRVAFPNCVAISGHGPMQCRPLSSEGIPGKAAEGLAAVRGIALWVCMLHLSWLCVQPGVVLCQYKAASVHNDSSSLRLAVPMPKESSSKRA